MFIILKPAIMVHTCSYCNKEFGRKDNLQRHLYHSHREEMSENDSNFGNTSDEEHEYNDPESDSSEYYSSSDTNTDSEDEEHEEGTSKSIKHRRIDIWKYFIDQTYDAMEDDLNDLVMKYRNNDHDGTLEDIRDEAFAELKSEYTKRLRQFYTDFMRRVYALQRDPFHAKIKQTAKRLREDEDFSKDEAVQYAAKKRKYLLENILDSYTLPEIEVVNESSSEEDTGSESNDETDSNNFC